MSKTDWSRLKNLMEKCEECKKDFAKTELIEYKEHKYCKSCLELVKENEKIECYGCLQEFKKDNITSYYGKDYCPECLEEEKERRKRKKQKSKTEVPSTVIVERAKDNTEEINDLKSELNFLKALILKSAPEKQTNVADFINDILMEFAGYDFDILVDDIINNYDLRKFDKGQGKSNFFYTMGNIQKEKEITNVPDKYKAARFINRIKRGDSKMYTVVFNLMRNKIIDIIKDHKQHIKNP